jgi:hypothetical protein
MFKNIIGSITMVIVIGILVFGAVNRSLAKVNDESSNLNQKGDGSVNYPSQDSQLDGKKDENQVVNTDHANEQIILPSAGEDELSENEIAGLLYLREEEKLAFDVYVNFYSQYGTRNFQNISQSELTHIESVKTLIDRYRLTDLASSEMGVFTNPDLQTLYNELVVRGNQSPSEALLVCAAIEEIDILDLKENLAKTDNADIQLVYENLLLGSKNHLRAFAAKLLQQTGETYEPHYLSLDAYQSIIEGDTQVGGNNQGAGSGIGGYQGNQP